MACLGTSVSALQLQLLQRHGLKQLLIALDGDSAGQAATERLLVQLQDQLVRGALAAAVLPMPEGQDADGLIRSQGASAMERLLAMAQHWLEWRLERLLAPLATTGAGPALAVLQALEREGLALAEALPEGVLRQRVEQRLALALAPAAGPASSAASAPAPPPAAPAAPTALVALTARQRAERRVLRLFIHAPPCRELLSCLALQDPACRVALEWLNNLAVVAVDGALAAMALRLAAEVPGAVGAALAQAAAPGPELLALLQRDPQGELQALLDVLEPVAGHA